jgi:hypothetical protein
MALGGGEPNDEDTKTGESVTLLANESRDDAVGEWLRSGTDGVLELRFSLRVALGPAGGSMLWVRMERSV